MTDARNKTRAVLDKNLREAQLDFQLRIAGFKAGEFPKKGEFPPKSNPIDHEVGGHLKRAIPKGYTYDPKALKPLAKTLWAMSVALGHALTAHRQFTKIKSSTVSPDGLVGGRGYVMAVKDIRKALYDACENLSAVSDTIHDELHAEHWQPKLAELEKSDIEDVERLVGDAERILDNPEEEVEDNLEEAEAEGPRAKMEEGEEGTKLPDGKNVADSYVDPHRTKQASEHYTYFRANSSVPVECESGPRVQHLDRGDVDQTGPFGSYNREESGPLEDAWSRDEGVGNDYVYQSEWDNELVSPVSDNTKNSSSFMPGVLTDNTPTEGRDFGLGYGEGNDAHGQGTEGYGNIDSDGKEVYGPYAELPSDPGGKLHDDEHDENDSTPAVELSVGHNRLAGKGFQQGVPVRECKTPAVFERTRLTAETAEAIIKEAEDVQIEPLPSRYEKTNLSGGRWKTASVPNSVLPTDALPSVARSDYYPGDKGDNEVNAETFDFGEEELFSDSELPTTVEKDYEYPLDMQPGVSERYEQGYQPYIKWSPDTHEMREDYVYQRGPIQGPFVGKG